MMPFVSDKYVAKDGDTRPCPRCHDQLVFSSRYPVLSVATIVWGDLEESLIRYERVWVCCNDRCDYLEPLDDAG